MSARIANYAEHVTLRKECGQKFGAIHELKLIKPNRLIQKILETSSEGVLDFGSGVDHHHKSEYQIPDDRYFSLDSDSSGAFDYRSLEEIPFGQKFDLVIMNQVIEHIQFDDCVEVIEQVSNILGPGGRLLITVPNVQHPVRYWGDVDHVTPWTFEDIYGVLRRIGFAVDEIGRFNKYRFPLNPLKRFILKTVCIGFRVDWCDSIVVLGRKA